MTRRPATYGNGQPWVDPEPPAPAPTCEHPSRSVVTVGGVWRKQYGFIPQRRVWQCDTCGAELGKVVEP